ncbi:response regulator, partial [Sulfurimonas sp. SAG-AH-194-I05]
EKHIDLGCYIDPSLEDAVKGDPTKLKEVLINLLSNAVKFTSSSGYINVVITKLHSDIEGKTRIKFEVEDSGIGVTSEQKNKIFEAFGQADTSITRKYGGTGLGLTISSKFIDLMGGQLDLHSEVGKGTTFFFILSFESVENLRDSNKDTYSNINALVLKDTQKPKNQADYLEKYLSFYGVNYTLFHNHDELRILRSQVDYDLLFIDYDYCSEDDLVKYSKQPQDLVLLTKATYMRKIDALELNIFKTLYEPLNNSKINLLLNTYHASKFLPKEVKITSREQFYSNASKFNAKVLVAEDNIINQKLIKRTLEDIGLEVSLASNGLQAFQKRKDEHFDLIFMDIQMPFLDGVEATKEILEYEHDYKQPHVPIIALTANALKGDRQRFIASGLDEYTTKPLVRDEILAILNQFLSRFIVQKEEKEIESTSKKSIHTLVKNEVGLDIVDGVEDIVINVNLDALDEKIHISKPPLKTIEEEQEEEDILSKDTYKADILLVKKTAFESKLYTKILNSLEYTYDTVSSTEDLMQKINANIYKTILFDKDYEKMNLKEFFDTIQSLRSKTSLSTKLILMSSSDATDDMEDINYVDEIIDNAINKELLRTLFAKYI